MKNSDKAKYKPMSKEKTDRFYHIIYWPVWFFFSLFRPVKAIGKENIPYGPAVVAANHSSNVDPVMAIFACGYRRPIRIMAKEELFHIPFLGWFLTKAGVFGVNRGQSDIAAVKRALKVLKEGCRLFIFPEGTRVKDGDDSSEAKTGAVMFAHRAGVPLVPMFIPRKKHWFRFTKIIIGEPYYPELPEKGTKQEDYKRAADELLEKIYALGNEYL